MYTFKSSPLIPHCSNRPKRFNKRHSRIKEQQYKILNPFRSGEQQNFLPHQLFEQIQDLEFISSTSIKKINMSNSTQNQRRSSNFGHQLHMMQNAARKQEQKFNGLTKSQSKKKQKLYVDNAQQAKIKQLQHPMSIEQMDNLSMDMEKCLHEINFRQMENEDFSLFEQGYEIDKENKNAGYFYSEQCIPQQTQNTDLDCYLNH